MPNHAAASATQSRPPSATEVHGGSSAAHSSGQARGSAGMAQAMLGGAHGDMASLNSMGGLLAGAYGEGLAAAAHGAAAQNMAQAMAAPLAPGMGGAAGMPGAPTMGQEGRLLAARGQYGISMSGLGALPPAHVGAMGGYCCPPAGAGMPPDMSTHAAHPPPADAMAHLTEGHGLRGYMPPAMPEGASSRKRNNAGDSMGRGRQPAAPRSSQPTLPPANLTQQQQHNLTQANLLAPHFASLAARGALDLHMRGAPLDAHMRSAMGATMGAGAMGALGGLPPHMRTTPLPGFGGLAPGMAPIQSMNAALAHMGWPPMPLPYPPALMATMAHDGMGCPTGLPTASLSTAGLPTAHPSASLNPAGLAHPVSTAHVGIGGIGGGGMGSGGTGGGRMNGGGLGGGGSMGVGGGMGGSVVSGHGMSGGGVDGGDGGGSMGGGGMSGSGNMSGGESSGHVSDGPLDESSGEEVMQLEGILEFLENWEQFERPSRDGGMSSRGSFADLGVVADSAGETAAEARKRGGNELAELEAALGSMDDGARPRKHGGVYDG